MPERKMVIFMHNCESKYTCYRIIILGYVHDIKSQHIFYFA